MDVGHAAEVPDHVGAFDLPGVPDFVASDIKRTAVAGDEEAVDELLLRNGADGGFGIVRAEAGQHGAHGIEQFRLLVLGQLGAAEAGEVILAALDDFGGAFIARFAAD